MFLRHLVPPPSIDIQINFTQIVPGEREPIRRGLNAREVAEYSDFGPVELSETVQDIGDNNH